MKHLLIFSLLFISLQAFSQKKETIEKQAATIDTLTQLNGTLMAQLDSLTTINAELTSALDSTSAGLDLYYGTIKEKVLIEDFDPAALPEIIDSLINSRDEKISGLSTSSETLSDSLSTVSAELATLKGTLATLENAESDKEKLVAELKQLKELLDSGIFTQEEYDSKKADLVKKW